MSSDDLPPILDVIPDEQHGVPERRVDTSPIDFNKSKKKPLKKGTSRGSCHSKSSRRPAKRHKRYHVLSEGSNSEAPVCPNMRLRLKATSTSSVDWEGNLRKLV